MTIGRDRLLAIFQEELEERRRDLEEGLVELGSGATPDRRHALVHELFRAAHSLKGAAASAGVDDIANVARQLEDVFARLRDDGQLPDRSEIARLLEEIDRLSAVAARPPGHHLPSGVAAQEQTPDASPSGAAPRDHTGPTTEARAATSRRVRLSGADLDAAIAATGELRLTVQRLEDLPAATAAARSTAQRAHVVWRTIRPALAHADADLEIRVEIERLERYLDVLAEDLRTLDELAVGSARHLVRVESDVRNAVGRLGLVPLGEVCAGLDRIARDLAAASGKDVRFRVAGGEIALDRLVAAALRDPLVHLVRNAVDHGIEPPGRREAVGKPTWGHVDVVADVEAGQLILRVCDDGAGVDLEMVVAAAASRGLADPAGADDALSLLFAPGVSTAGRVTDVSGRGVGLDVVRAATESLGGSVAVSSEHGGGTEVTLRVPVTLSSLPAVVVRVEAETVALPATTVDRVVRLAGDEVVVIEGVDMVGLDDRMVRLVDLGWLLGFSSSPTLASRDGKFQAIVVRTPDGEVALAIEAGVTEHDVVLRGLGARLGGVPGLLGATVLRDGSAGLVLNPATWVRRALDTDVRSMGSSDATDTARHRVLLAEDTLTTRTLERSILEAAGYDVTVAVDGAEAWRLLQRNGADIVVSDVDMPHMDGFALCEAIRSSERFADIPVVLVTSLGDEHSRARGVRVGANAYVVKSSFDQASLIETISRLL